MPWLRFFRVVNLPTVPGDVITGAAVSIAFSDTPVSSEIVRSVLAAAASSVFIYMFALADNDIVGRDVDVERPIPEGNIRLLHARIAALACLAAAAATGVVFSLPVWWYAVAAVIVIFSIAYNRTKIPSLMGACRMLNVFAGAAVLGPAGLPAAAAVVAVGALWWGYITWVTRFSSGEESDARLRDRVGFFIGAIVYLQLAVLVIFPVRPFLLCGAAMLVALRVLKIALPKVSAS